MGVGPLVAALSSFIRLTASIVFTAKISFTSRYASREKESKFAN